MTPSLGTFVAFKISVISSFPSLQYTSILFSLHIHIYPLSFVAHCMWYHDGAFYRSSGALYRSSDALYRSSGALYRSSDALYTALMPSICFSIVLTSVNYWLLMSQKQNNFQAILIISLTYKSHTTPSTPSPPPPPSTLILLLYDLNTTLITML